MHNKQIYKKKINGLQVFANWQVLCNLYYVLWLPRSGFFQVIQSHSNDAMIHAMEGSMFLFFKFYEEGSL